jgi:hypothetical protein
MIESKDLPAHDIQRALQTCTTENVQKAQVATTIFRNFEDQVAAEAELA